MRFVFAAVLIAPFALGACDGRRSPDSPRALPGEAPSKVAANTPSETVAVSGIPSDAPLVVVLGDSIAAGLHLSVDEAFPAVLQRDLVAAGTPFRLVNAGVSGDTSAGGLRRVDWVLKQKPDVLIVELGGNDGLRGQDLAGVEANLRGVVTRAKDGGTRVLLLGIQIPTSYGADYAGRFAAMYARIAEELGVDFVSEFFAGVGGVPDMTLDDGLHPTASGQVILARNVAPVLTRVLAELQEQKARR